MNHPVSNGIRRTRGVELPDLVLLPLGFTVWSVLFVVVYGMQGLGCAWDWHQIRVGPISMLRVALIAIWLAFLTASLMLAVWSWRRMTVDDSMLRKAVSGSSLAAAVAVFYTGIPNLVLTMC